MERYKNLSHNSGISHYVIGKDFIKIKFNEESAIYIYNHVLNGQKHIETMKKLAVKGKGLSAYIAQHPEVKNYFIKQST